MLVESGHWLRRGLHPAASFSSCVDCDIGSGAGCHGIKQHPDIFTSCRSFLPKVEAANRSSSADGGGHVGALLSKPVYCAMVVIIQMVGNMCGNETWG